MAKKSWSPEEILELLEQSFTDSDGSICGSISADDTIESDLEDTTETFHEAFSFFTSGEDLMYSAESDPVVADATEGVSGEMMRGSSETSGRAVEESMDYSAGEMGNSASVEEIGQASSSHVEDSQFLQPLPVSPAVRGSRRREGRRGGRIVVRGRRAVGVGEAWTLGQDLIEAFSSDDQIPPQLASRSQAARTARGGYSRRARATARATRPLGRSDHQLANEAADDEMGGTFSSDDEINTVHSSPNVAYLFPDDPSAASFSWTGISSFAGQREQFVPEKAGPTAEYPTPYDAFRAIWTDEILDVIVEETNKYSRDSRRLGHQSSSWRGTNRHEILILFAFYMMLGIIRMPTIRSCFSTSWIMKTSVFRKLLSITRFRELTKYLYFNDNDLIHTDPENKKLAKILPIINHLNAKFKELYIPSQNIAIDESLTMWKGHLGFKQYITTKAARFGIKSFELCESVTGYLWSFNIYTGKDTSLVGSLAQKVLESTHTVVNLIRPLLNKGYCLWMGNWFNSPLLARFLKRNKTDCAGILHTNRTDVPIAFSRIREGQIFGRHTGDVAILSWQDKKRVTTISTFHGAETEKGRSRGRENVYKPQVIRDYNHYMGGVDKKDQMLEPYLIESKRCRKWYLKLFKRLLNVSIHNAKILHSQSQTSEVKTLAFRLALVQGLASHHLTLSRPPKSTRQSSVGPYTQPFSLSPDAHYFDYNDSPQARDANDPAPLQKGRSQNCVICKKSKVRKSTVYCCKTCRVPLCVVPCFEKYHTTLH